MKANFGTRLKEGINSLATNHQLLYTIGVAIVIFASFFFVVNRFVTIAEDAQQDLANVRVGSIHDTFVVFARDDFNNPAGLNSKITEIAEINKTIVEFDVVRVIDKRDVVIASKSDVRVGEEYVIDSTFRSFLFGNANSSFTVPGIQNGERVFSTGRLITDSEGEALGYVITLQTLSEADRLLENAIRNSLWAFMLIVIVLILLFFRFARVVDYATLYKRLKEVDQLKDDFIAMASHELRSPLATIRGYIELIRDQKNLNEDQVEYARRTELAAANLNDLVADMLDVSRMEQGRMQFEYTDFNIEEMVTEVIQAFEREAGKKNLELKKGDLKEIVLHLDERKVHRVLVNLVSNAVKYTMKGSVTVSYKAVGDILELRVSDTGIGISKEDQEKLFGKFYRVKSAETREVQGTGLGLWLSREIIRKQKGDITVESIQGKGTDFVVTLPITRDGK